MRLPQPCRHHTADARGLEHFGLCGMMIGHTSVNYGYPSRVAVLPDFGAAIQWGPVRGRAVYAWGKPGFDGASCSRGAVVLSFLVGFVVLPSVQPITLGRDWETCRAAAFRNWGERSR